MTEEKMTSSQLASQLSSEILLKYFSEEQINEIPAGNSWTRKESFDRLVIPALTQFIKQGGDLDGQRQKVSKFISIALEKDMLLGKNFKNDDLRGVVDEILRPYKIEHPIDLSSITKNYWHQFYEEFLQPNSSLVRGGNLLNEDKFLKKIHSNKDYNFVEDKFSEILLAGGKPDLMPSSDSFSNLASNIITDTNISGEGLKLQFRQALHDCFNNMIEEMVANTSKPAGKDIAVASLENPKVNKISK